MAKILQNRENEYNVNWDPSLAYIHWHEINAMRAAGNMDINTIRSQALHNTQLGAIGRLNATVYNSDIDPNTLVQFDNGIQNINDAVNDSQAVTNMILDFVDQAVNVGASGLNGHALAGEISTLIGGVRSNSKKRTLEELDRIFTILYDQDVHSLIQSLSKNSSSLNTIKQQQLESLKELETFITKEGAWDKSDKTSVRNLLVDILTEQGLPDFLEKCAASVPQAISQVLEPLESIQLGKVKLASTHRAGKIDTMITFILPDGRRVRQGVSLKNNWAGYQAAILSTSLHASLNYGHIGNQYVMANAISLMDINTLKAWIEWTNIDRALQGTMTVLENGLQDKADLLIEFTSHGLQVFNINYLMYKLTQEIKLLNGNVRLTEAGFGMQEKYGLAVKAYDRQKFAGADIDAMVKERSQYTAQWLNGTHSIVLNAEKMLRHFMS